MARCLFAVLLVALSTGSPCFAQGEIKPVATYRGHVESARCVAFCPDGKLLASGSDDQAVILWDLAAGKPRAILEGHKTSVWVLAFSPVGGLLASGTGQPTPGRQSGDDYTIKLWDVNTSRVRRTLEGCPSNVFCMAFSPDGKVLAACHNFTQGSNVKLWNVATGKMLASLKGHFAKSLAFSHDGKLLATGGGETIEVWDLATGARKAVFSGFDQHVYGLSFSPDDKSLAVGTAKMIKLCDAQTGKEIRTLQGSTFFPNQVLFSPDGKQLVAASSDYASVKMWDVQTGNELVIFKATAFAQPSGVAFSPDGAIVASANGDSTVTVWHNPLSKQPLPAVKDGTKAAPGKSAPPMPKTTAPERAKDFQWFTGLGYPDVKDAQFVKVFTNSYSFQFSAQFSFGTESSKTSGQVSPSVQNSFDGFLLESQNDRFTVMTLSLVKEIYKVDANAPAIGKVRFEPADLKALAAATLQQLRAPPAKERGWSRERRPSPRTQAFVLAWVCWRRGLDDLAAALYHEAVRMPTGFGQYPDRAPTRPLRELVAEELADTVVPSAMAALGLGPDISWVQVLLELEKIAKRFPEFANHEDAAIVIPLLRQMVQEDIEHAKKVRPFDQLDQKDQIAELIYQLRDQAGYVAPSNLIYHPSTFEDPIDFRVDHDPWPDGLQSPAQQLVKLAIPAASQLIDHIEDERLTRSIVTGLGSSELSFSRDVLRVGDCAAIILQRISGRKFAGENYLPVETKRRILAWQADVQNKGEQQTLTEGVARGDEESFEQAIRLVAKYPEASLPAIAAGLKVCKDDEIRNWLLRAAGRLKEDDSLLLAELKKGPSASGRLQAAKILHRRGRPEAVAGLIELWNSELLQKKDENDRMGVAADVAHALISTLQLEAIAAVGRDLLKRPVGLRQSVVDSCLNTLNPFDGSFMDPKRVAPKLAREVRVPLNPKRVDPKLPREVRVALERLLVSLLDDKAEDPKWNPPTRTCDNAARAFNQLSPTKYPFNPDASIKELDRAIINIKSVWQMENGATMQKMS